MSFRDKLKNDIVLFDGGLGTYLEVLGVTTADFHGRQGCMEYLTISRPDIVSKVHRDYFSAGADAVETNTFGGNALKLADYNLADKVFDINRQAALLARKEADRFSDDAERYVIGSMGPTGKLPSSNDPSLGDIDYEQLKRIYQEQAIGLISGGVDGLIIETSQDLLEMKAAINGAKAAIYESGKDIVIITQVTMSDNGRMLLGTDMMSVIGALSLMDVDVIGLNCSTGPEGMKESLKILNEKCPVYISCMPNAGLPREKDGQIYFDLGPEEMALEIKDFVEKYGVDIVGGCCGTTPEHIAAIKKILGPKKKRDKTERTFFASMFSGFELTGSRVPVIVGERVNTQGSKKMKEILLAEDHDSILELGKEQKNAGADILDICTVLTERDTEKKDMEIIVSGMMQSIDAPLMIDSTDTDVIEAALKKYAGTGLINSVNLEDGEIKADRIFSLAKEYGAFVVCLTIDERGMAKTIDGKIDIVRRLYDIGVRKHGLHPRQLIFDMLTFTLGTGENEYKDSAVNTFDAIKRSKKEFPGILTILGVSNVSYGLEKNSREVLNERFLYHAVKNGLDLAIINPSKRSDPEKISRDERKYADDLIFNRSPRALDDFVSYFAGRKNITDGDVHNVSDTVSVENRIKKCILDRNKTMIEGLIDEALIEYDPEDVINNILIETMRDVGDKLGAGELVLPYVLQSAEVMRKAMEHVFRSTGSKKSQIKGKILLATVFGDVHDIGKNLVKMIFENNGYEVIDLGKQVPAEEIVRAAEDNKVDIVGLSALLVSTAKYMSTCVEYLHESRINCPVIIGGAPTNDKFALEISILSNGSIYEGGVFYAKDAFNGLDLVRNIFDEKIYKTMISEYMERSSRIKREKDGAKTFISPRKHPKRKIITNIPKPPFIGVKMLKDIPYDKVFDYLDTRLLFEVIWGSGIKDKEEERKIIMKEYIPLLKGFEEEAVKGGWFDFKAVYGYFKCRISGEDMFILGNDNEVLEVITFESPVGGRSTMLTDYFSSSFSDNDIVAFQAVTIGDNITRVISEKERSEEYRDMYFIHGLGVSLAESLAAFVHDHIRGELQLKSGQGKRYSPGYPLWKNIEDQKKIFRLLEIEKNLNVKLTEGYQMVPEGSTTAMIVHNELAEY